MMSTMLIITVNKNDMISYASNKKIKFAKVFTFSVMDREGTEVI